MAKCGSSMAGGSRRSRRRGSRRGSRRTSRRGRTSRSN